MARYDVDNGSGTAIDHAYIPAMVNVPYIFRPPKDICLTDKEVWCAVSCSDANYGGCIVWGSVDGSTYAKIGKIYGNATQGALNTALAANSTEYDSVNVLSVRLNQLSEDVVSVSTNALDFGYSLCLVSNEILGYQTATFTSVSGGKNNFNLSFLRRGLYGTTKGAAINTRFALLNRNIFKYRFNQALEGNYVYFKFQGFNAVEGGLQDISTVTAYSYIIPVVTVPGVTAAYEVRDFREGKTTQGVITRAGFHIFTKTVTFPVGFTGSIGRLAGAPTVAQVFSIYQNTTVVGTMNFAAGSTVATFSVSTALTYNSGDIMHVINLSTTADTTMSSIAFTMLGSYLV